MLLDTHTNLMWYPDHLSDEFVRFAWQAKKAKMKLTPDVYFAGSDAQERNAFDSTPKQLLEASMDVDKVIVFGIKAPFCGINADQHLIAEFVKQHIDKFIGWCSVDPNDKDCVDQLVHYVNDLGFRGLKCSPIYQNWDPQDPRHLPLFKKAEALGIPVNIHQGTSFVRAGWWHDSRHGGKVRPPRMDVADAARTALRSAMRLLSDSKAREALSA